MARRRRAGPCTAVSACAIISKAYPAKGDAVFAKRTFLRKGHAISKSLNAFLASIEAGKAFLNIAAGGADPPPASGPKCAVASSEDRLDAQSRQKSGYARTRLERNGEIASAARRTDENRPGQLAIAKDQLPPDVLILIGAQDLVAF